jgi:hypothetical protein
MSPSQTMKILSAAILGGALACVASGARADTKLEGTYLAPEGGLILQKMVFKAPNIVTLTMMTQTMRGTYTVDGTDVIISMGGQQTVFTLDKKGCLDSGGVMGKVCKA